MKEVLKLSTIRFPILETFESQCINVLIQIVLFALNTIPSKKKEFVAAVQKVLKLMKINESVQMSMKGLSLQLHKALDCFK